MDNYTYVAGMGMEGPVNAVHPFDLDSAMAYDFLGGMKTTAHYYVNGRSSMRIAAFWQAIHLISSDVAKLPCNVYEVLERDGRQVARSHPVQKVLSIRPNKYMSAFRFWRRMARRRSPTRLLYSCVMFPSFIA